MTVDGKITKIAVMQLRDDDLADFLIAYAVACNETGMAPLPSTLLAEIAEFILASAFDLEERLH